MSTDSPKTARATELEKLNKLPTVDSALPEQYGVLLSDQIKKCVDEFELISPFNADQLKAASYRLTVGERYALGGRTSTLRVGEEIKIEPFEVVVIQTLERLNLPRNMIARWNIKVSRAYEGLIWAGGPQVDPGYQGHLFCPIYNLRDRTVTLHYGDQIAVIDFIKTTAFGKDCRKFDRPPAAVVLEDYITDWKSALSRAYERMQATDEKMKNMEATFGFFVAITFAVMGVLVAALSIKPEKPFLSSLPTLLGLTALTLSLIALLMKGIAMPATDLKTWRRVIFFALWILSSAVFGGLCWWLAREYGWPLR